MAKDLGYSYDECCMPEPIGKSKDKKHYPSVHLESAKDLDIPESGTITFKFVKKSETKRLNDDGKERYECTLKLKSIERTQKTPVKGEKALPVEDTEAALDKIKAALED